MAASTFLGGSGNEGWEYSGAFDVAVAADGTVYVTGVTASADVPVTAGAHQGALAGQSDIFLAIFLPEYSALLAATYLGGSGREGSPTVGFDGDGHVYVAGFTRSVNFPTTAGAYDVSFNGASAYENFFVAKLNGSLTTLLASTYLGGSREEFRVTPVLDAEGNVYLTGGTQSVNYPTTAGVHDGTFNGPSVGEYVHR